MFPIIPFLIAILVLVIIIYVIDLVIGMLNLPPQIKTIAFLIVGLVALLYILSLFGVNVGTWR